LSWKALHCRKSAGRKPQEPLQNCHAQAEAVKCMLARGRGGARAGTPAALGHAVLDNPRPTRTRDVDAILFVSQKHPPPSDDRFLVRKIDLDRDCEFSGGLQPG
jgi:hypothetical protein